MEVVDTSITDTSYSAWGSDLLWSSGASTSPQEAVAELFPEAVLPTTPATTVFQHHKSQFPTSQVNHLPTIRPVSVIYLFIYYLFILN